MKFKRAIILLFVTCFCTSGILAQEQESSLTQFIEMNVGMAYFPGSFAFPGASFLYGHTHNFKSGYLLEYEAGFAFPTVVTGKVGVGKRFENTESSIGMRLSPGTMYFQQRFKIKDNSSMVFGVEYGPEALSIGGPDSFIPSVGESFGDLLIVNFGYRWHVGGKKR